MVVQISEFLLRLLLAERIITKQYNSQYFSIAFDKCKFGGENLRFVTEAKDKFMHI